MPAARCSTSWRSRPVSGSDLQEDLAAVHPETDEPEDARPGERRGDRSIRHVEERVAEVGLDGLQDPALEHLPHAVHRGAVHPHDDERKSPALPAPDVDDPIEAGQNPERPPRAEERPRRRPVPLDDRADHPRAADEREDLWIAEDADAEADGAPGEERAEFFHRLKRT